MPRLPEFCYATLEVNLSPCLLFYPTRKLVIVYSSVYVVKLREHADSGDQWTTVYSLRIYL